MNKKFCDRMKRLRNESGKTQGEMAELLGVQRSTYGEYERGKIMPPVEKTGTVGKDISRQTVLSDRVGFGRASG